MGLICKQQPNKALGAMITASHNPVQDNGLKLADFDGCMLNDTFEK